MVLKTLTSDKTEKLEDIFHSNPPNRRSASTNQRRSHMILMDGGDQYTKGIVSAYCQFRGWVLTSAMDFSDAMRRCDGLDVRAIVLNLGTLNNKDLAESVSRFRSASSIPVCQP